MGVKFVTCCRCKDPVYDCIIINITDDEEEKDDEENNHRMHKDCYQQMIKNDLIVPKKIPEWTFVMENDKGVYELVNTEDSRIGKVGVIKRIFKESSRVLDSLLERNDNGNMTADDIRAYILKNKYVHKYKIAIKDTSLPGYNTRNVRMESSIDTIIQNIEHDVQQFRRDGFAVYINKRVDRLALLCLPKEHLVMYKSLDNAKKAFENILEREDITKWKYSNTYYKQKIDEIDYKIMTQKKKRKRYYEYLCKK